MHTDSTQNFQKKITHTPSTDVVPSTQVISGFWAHPNKAKFIMLYNTQRTYISFKCMQSLIKNIWKWFANIFHYFFSKLVKKRLAVLLTKNYEQYIKNSWIGSHEIPSSYQPQICCRSYSYTKYERRHSVQCLNWNLICKVLHMPS